MFNITKTKLFLKIKLKYNNKILNAVNIYKFYNNNTNIFL